MNWWEMAAFLGKILYEKRYTSILGRQDAIYGEKLPENTKPLKGIRALHCFHGESIAIDYELSVKSLERTRQLLCALDCLKGGIQAGRPRCYIK